MSVKVSRLGLYYSISKRKFPNKPWDWAYLSKRKNLDFRLVIEVYQEDKNWNWSNGGLSEVINNLNCINKFHIINFKNIDFGYVLGFKTLKNITIYISKSLEMINILKIRI